MLLKGGRGLQVRYFGQVQRHSLKIQCRACWEGVTVRVVVMYLSDRAHTRYMFDPETEPKNHNEMAREMAHLPRALTALPEDLALISIACKTV